VGQHADKSRAHEFAADHQPHQTIEGAVLRIERIDDFARHRRRRFVNLAMGMQRDLAVRIARKLEIFAAALLVEHMGLFRRVADLTANRSWPSAHCVLSPSCVDQNGLTDPRKQMPAIVTQ
jgi:hypothetical protein